MNIQTATWPPRMTTDADLASIRKSIAGFAGDLTAVEFGPWLGSVSLVLGEKFDLHVIDRFQWTTDHAKKVPGVLEPGGNFRPLLEKTLTDFDVSAEVHESLFETFTWDAGELDLIFVDGPKTAVGLKECLSSVVAALRPSGRILLKNGLSPIYTDLAAYLERLIDADVLSVPPQDIERESNVLSLCPGKNFASFERVRPFDPDWGVKATISRKLNLSEDHSYRFLEVVAAIGAADWLGAFQQLSDMKPQPGLARSWETMSLKSLTTKSNAAMIETLSEAVGFHHEQPAKGELPISICGEAEQVLRGYWANTVSHPWRAAAYQPEIFRRAHDFGYMQWPDRIKEHVWGKDVLDIGCGPGLHGLGYLAAGAKSYLGLDPILKPDRDRSKNLAQSKKEAFGWTPNQISRLVAPWHASAEPVGDTALERRFDICTMHNVTEHLHRLEEIFADIAARLRVGGRLLYNHHNFYCWNGHHLPPKTTSKIDLSDPMQREMIDWKHLDFEPTPDHYIARGLNRIKLDELIEITEQHFDIEVLREIPSASDQGIERLTDEIRERHPDLTERDLTTQNLFCIAVLKS